MERQLISSNYQLFKIAVVQLFRLNSSEVAGMKAIVFPATRGSFVFRLLLFVMILPLTAAIFFLPFVFCLFVFSYYILRFAFLDALDASRIAWTHSWTNTWTQSWTHAMRPYTFSWLPSGLKRSHRYSSVDGDLVAQSIKHHQYIISAPLRFFNFLAKKGLSFLSYLFYLLSFLFCLLSFYLLSLTF